MMQLIALALIILPAILESISYPGLVYKYTHLPMLVFPLLGLVLLTKASKSQFINRLLLSFATLITIIFFIALLFENFFYENFIFTHFHLNIPSLTLLTALSLLTYHLSILKKASSLAKITRASLTALLVFLIVQNFALLSPKLVRALTPLVLNPTANYDDKLTNAYESFYPAMQLVKQITPEDVTIVIPPQAAPWVTEGNAALVTRFLYPRKVVHQDELVESSRAYHLIARGSWPSDGTYEHGWPKVVIEAERVWRFDLDEMSYQTFDDNYDPRDLWDWGLIEVAYD